MSDLFFDLHNGGSFSFDATTTRKPGQDIFLDRNQNAQVVVSDAPLKALEIYFYRLAFQMGVHEADGVTIDGDLAEGAKISVDGEVIATVDQSTSTYLSFAFTDKATADRAAKLIQALTFNDMSDYKGFDGPTVFEFYLSDTAENYAYAYVEVGDSVIGTDGADTFVANFATIGIGDELDGGAGDDTLQLNGGSTFDLKRMSKLVGVETIQGSDSSDRINIHSSQWSDLKRLDGKGGTNILSLYGSDSDLTQSEILNFDEIDINDNNAKVRVADVETALHVVGRSAQGEELVIKSGTLGAAQRFELHNRGIDKITTLEDGHTSVQGAPKLGAFGDAINASAGTTVFLDKGQDAVLDVTRGGLSYLRVKINSFESSEELGLVASNGLTLTNGLQSHSELFMAVTTPDGTVHNIKFGFVGSLNEMDPKIHELSFYFNENAKVEWVEQLIRSLTYTNSAEIVGERHITLMMRDVGDRDAKADVIVKPAAADPDANKAPANLSLDGSSILENADPGALVGTLGATDEDGDPLTYTLSDDAEGRFEIKDGKLVVKDGSRLDFETAASHKVTVAVSDGKVVVTKDFIIQIDDVVETVPEPDTNKAPANLSLSGTSILENADPGASVGTLSATDEDGDPLTYTLSDDAEGRFEIQGDKLLVKDGSRLDFETAASHKVTVAVSDGKVVVTKDFIVQVDDVIETVEPPPEVNKAPTDLSLSGSAISENSASGTIVGTLTASDEDGDALSYTLTDNAEGRFEIRGDRLVVKEGTKLNFEAASSHRVTVSVSDGKAVVARDFVIQVDDVMETVLGATRGKNVLKGGIGADRIDGGLGNDTLAGRAGQDIFVFSTKLAKTNKLNKKQNLDKIVDFSAQDDTIHLKKSIFSKISKKGPLKKGEFYIGSKAHDRDDHIIYNKKTGALFYDPDGTGAKEAIQFATLSKNLKMTYHDFLVI